jgi:hypothetical protein
MVALIKRMRSLEERKRQVAVGSAEFVELAREVDDLSRLIFRWSALQLEAAEQSVSQVNRGQMEGVPIEAVEPRPLDEILAAWREAQLRFELAVPGSRDAVAVAAEVERLRHEFHAAEEERRSTRP